MWLVRLTVRKHLVGLAQKVELLQVDLHLVRVLHRVVSQCKLLVTILEVMVCKRVYAVWISSEEAERFTVRMP